MHVCVCVSWSSGEGSHPSYPVHHHRSWRPHGEALPGRPANHLRVRAVRPELGAWLRLRLWLCALCFQYVWPLTQHGAMLCAAASARPWRRCAGQAGEAFHTRRPPCHGPCDQRRWVPISMTAVVIRGRGSPLLALWQCHRRVACKRPCCQPWSSCSCPVAPRCPSRHGRRWWKRCRRSLPLPLARCVPCVFRCGWLCVCH